MLVKSRRTNHFFSALYFTHCIIIKAYQAILFHGWNGGAEKKNLVKGHKLPSALRFKELVQIVLQVLVYILYNYSRMFLIKS